MSSSATAHASPFDLMVNPKMVQAAMTSSTALKRLRYRECRPLDRQVIRSASAELAAFDAKIDRHTKYLAPGE